MTSARALRQPGTTLPPPPDRAPHGDPRMGMVLVLGDPVLQRLVASWGMVTPLPGERWSDEVYPRWSKLAGLGVTVVAESCAPLFASGLCRHDGTTDELASGMLQMLAAVDAHIPLGTPRGGRT